MTGIRRFRLSIKRSEAVLRELAEKRREKSGLQTTDYGSIYQLYKKFLMKGSENT